MKKWTAAALALGLCLALCACGADSGGSASSAGTLQSELDSLQQENEALTAENEELKKQSSQNDASQEEGSGDTDASRESDNPIDSFFTPYQAKAETTYAMNVLYGAWRDAWHDELTAFVQDMETTTSDSEDLQDLHAYLENAEAQAEILTQMTYLVGAGAETPRDQRPADAGTLAPVTSASSGREVYQNAFYRLYWVRYPEESHEEAQWSWHFTPTAAKTQLDAALSG